MKNNKINSSIFPKTNKKIIILPFKILHNQKCRKKKTKKNQNLQPKLVNIFKKCDRKSSNQIQKLIKNIQKDPFEIINCYFNNEEEQFQNNFQENIEDFFNKSSARNLINNENSFFNSDFEKKIESNDIKDVKEKLFFPDFS